MTPEEFYWHDKMQTLTRETIQFYEAKFAKEADYTHPILVEVHKDERKCMAHRISAAWRRVENVMTWQTFIDVTTFFLEGELYGDMEPENLTDNVISWVHFYLLDMGIEVKKIRNGYKISSQNATRELRSKVMAMVINERLLDSPTVEDIKLKIYQSIANK